MQSLKSVEEFFSKADTRTFSMHHFLNWVIREITVNWPGCDRSSLDDPNNPGRSVRRDGHGVLESVESAERSGRLADDSGPRDPVHDDVRGPVDGLVLKEREMEGLHAGRLVVVGGRGDAIQRWRGGEEDDQKSESSAVPVGSHRWQHGAGLDEMQGPIQLYISIYMIDSLLFQSFTNVVNQTWKFQLSTRVIR